MREEGDERGKREDRTPRGQERDNKRLKCREGDETGTVVQGTW